MTQLHKLFQVVIATSALMSPAMAGHLPNHVDVKVNVSALSVRAASGQAAFNQSCAQCHGVNGQGSDQGPPLIHPIYNPGHHGNQSIYNAVLRGVGQHHWSFGNMPPQKVSFGDLANIVQFVREVQGQNGIQTEAHVMR